MQAALPQMGHDVPDDERAAACALAGLGGIGAQSLAVIRDVFGSLSAAVSKGAEGIASTPGLRADGVESLRKAPDLARRGRWLLEKARACGARVLVQSDADYPEEFRQWNGPPVLYVQGAWSATTPRRVAVVGTRDPDRYGVEHTRSAVERLCAAGVEVVSGGALGVDRVAHETAMQLGGRTVGVVGTGLLNPYPADNRPLYERLAKEGTLISEFALDAGGQRNHFPQRNRTMAMLSEAVIITRGKEGSGALTTCSAAIRFGKPVFAVPGSIGDPLAWAPNAQLSEGAKALVTGDEVLAALKLHAPKVTPAAPKEDRTLDLSRLPDSVRRVFQALGPASRHVDEIAAEAGVPTAEALAALLRLELYGLCAAQPGKYFLRR